jgi:hypothetical protein
MGENDQRTRTGADDGRTDIEGVSCRLRDPPGINKNKAFDQAE